MKRRVNLASIEKHLPEGFALPSGFRDFVRVAGASDPTTCGWYQVLWTSPARAFALERSAATRLVPFLRLGDGGIVAFWIENEKTVPIVRFDSEGGHALIASDFDDFVARVGRRKSGVPDIDESDEPLRLRKTRARKPSSLGASAKRFDEWCNASSASRKPSDGADGERVRRAFVDVAKAMLRDGASRVYTVRAPWWDMNYRVTPSVRGVEVTYMGKGGAHGRWPRVPAKYGIAPHAEALLTLVRNKNHEAYEVVVTKSGIVSVDRDRQLLLRPPNA